MEIRNVYAAYFSGTGTTEKTVTEIATTIASGLNAGEKTVELKTYDFTLPDARKNPPTFSENDLVIFGTPVIAGRVPNLLLKFLDTLKGNGAYSVPVVLFGNRNFDDALIELRDILRNHEYKPIAAGAFIGEHSFSTILAAGRPDEKDMILIRSFADTITEKIIRYSKNEDDANNHNSADDESLTDFHVEGVPYPYRGYYQPRDRNENPINILKVKPLTNENCIDCKLCAKLCPLQSISYENVSEIPGICMKCCACVKKCPVQAKYYNDEGYLYHQHELEEMYARRAEPSIYF